jgi:uncharacterized membrane protein
MWNGWSGGYSVRGTGIADWQGQLNGPADAGPVFTNHSAAGYSPLMYFNSGIGIRIIKWCGGSLYWAVTAGRLCNLIFWMAAVFLAIRITPVFRFAFLFTALLPTSVFQGMLLSADSFSNAIAYLFTAMMFRMIYTKGPIKTRPILTIMLMTWASAWSKGLILPIALVLLIPAERFKDGWKTKYPVFLLCLSTGIAIVAVWNEINEWAHHPAGGADPEAQLRYVMAHPLVFIDNLWYSLQLHARFLWAQLIGCLGWQNVYFSVRFYLMVTFAFLSIFVFTRTNDIKWSHRVFAASLLVLYVVTLHLHLYRVWNPVGNPIIGGVLGRYFLPVLPLLFPVLSHGIIRMPPLPTTRPFSACFYWVCRW